MEDVENYFKNILTQKTKILFPILYKTYL